MAPGYNGPSDGKGDPLRLAEGLLSRGYELPTPSHPDDLGVARHRSETVHAAVKAEQDRLDRSSTVLKETPHH
jgi:hypothetical protein